MGKPVSSRTRVPWRGGLAALIGTDALTIWGFGGQPDPLDEDQRWPLGWSLDPITCAEGWRWDPTCGVQATTQIDGNGDIVVVVDEAKPDRDDLCEPVGGQPFGIGASGGCSIVNVEDPVATYAQAALDALALSSWRDIADELWSGTIAQFQLGNGTVTDMNQFLTNDADAGEECGFDDLCPGEVAGLSEALYELDYYLGSVTNDAGGLIHADWKTLYRWVEKELVDRDGPFRYRTKVGGFYVVTDPRYSGSGPLSGGQVAADVTASWAYATGPLQVRWLEPRIFPNPTEAEFSAMVDHRQNHIRFVVESQVGISWTCAHGGIQVASCDAPPEQP